MTLVEFLWARLDEDAAAAKAATPGPWRVVNVTDYRSATVDGPDALQDGGFDETIKARRQVMRPQTVIPPDVDYGSTVDLADAEHMARHDPARVLAEVEAKRQRIEHYLDVCRLSNPVTDKHQAYVLAEGAVRKSLMFDALPYADHPDYQEEWKP